MKTLIWVVVVLFLLLNLISATNAYKFTHFYDQGQVVVHAGVKLGTWDAAKDLIFGKDYVKKRNRDRPDSFSTVILTTSDHLKLEGWYRTTPDAVGTVALFHGYGENKTDVLPEAMAFLNMGYNVFLIDFRGHGNSEGNTTTIGYLEAEDVKASYDFIKGKGEKNIVLWGISMGAASIAHAIDEFDLRPSKVILEMPFATMEDAVEGQVRLMHLPVEPLATLLTFWGGVEQGYWAFNIRPLDYVKKIHCPVLMQSGLKDIRVTALERKEVFDNLNPPKQLVIYKNSGHESLCKKEHLKWLASVSAFLNS